LLAENLNLKTENYLFAQVLQSVLNPVLERDMNNTITAQEIKRRGISAVDEALRKGPVHVIQRNHPRYVILSEEEYARLADQRQARAELWDQLMTGPASGARSKSEIDAQLDEERASWDRTAD